MILKDLRQSLWVPIGKTQMSERLINLLSATQIPTVVDADALYAIGQQSLDPSDGDHVVLTLMTLSMNI